MKIRFVFAGVFSIATSFAFAQAEVEASEVNQAFKQEIEEQYNPNSIDPIPLYEQHFKFRTWRSVDLMEKQNKGFFAKNGEITKLILEAIASGEIADIYEDDSLVRKKSKEDFFKSMQQSGGETFPAWEPGKDFYTDDKVTYNGKDYRALQDSKGANPETATDSWAETAEGKAVTYQAGDISSLRIMEDVIFDRRRSRLYYDIQGIAIEIPAAKTTIGFNVTLGWLKYKDLEKVFRAHPKKAVWFNRQNTAQNKNFADAFLLRLFWGPLYRVQNPDNETIFETYQANGRTWKEAVWATEWEEMKLMEKEHNLWEF